MSDLLASIPVTRLLPDGHMGPAGATGVTAQRVDGLSAATLVARKGAGDHLAAALAAAGFALPPGPNVGTAGGLEIVGTGPGRWLVFGADALSRLAPVVAGLAALTDQSDANLVFDVSGPQVRAALAKGVNLDLDPRAFVPGDAATTSIALVGVTFWQRDMAPTYRFAVARSYAPAFLRWLSSSAAEFGFTLSGMARG